MMKLIEASFQETVHADNILAVKLMKNWMPSIAFGDLDDAVLLRLTQDIPDSWHCYQMHFFL